MAEWLLDVRGKFSQTYPSNESPWESAELWLLDGYIYPEDMSAHGKDDGGLFTHHTFVSSTFKTGYRHQGKYSILDTIFNTAEIVKELKGILLSASLWDF